MKITIDVDGELSQKEIALFLKEISIDPEFIKSIKFEKSEGEE
jgi:hypothetical protein